MRGTWREGYYTEEMEHFLYRALYGEPKAPSKGHLINWFIGLDYSPLTGYNPGLILASYCT